MYKKHYYITFAFLQVAISILIFTILRQGSARDAVLVYAYQLPIWGLFTFFMIPKTENKNVDVEAKSFAYPDKK